MKQDVFTVLVADDQREVIALISGWLRETGHVPLAATSGREAVALLRALKVDALVTDLVMPNGSGLDLIFDARAHFPELRIVAISGAHQGEAAQAAGADRWLRKPLFRDDLLAALRPPRALS
ncbi:MAG: response regulator [Opitutus sp.]|nr:response regulator [Opitutus sp.]